MDCLTNTSVFTNGLGPGNVCSGRGTCVNGFCVCEDMWTGRSDYLDLNGFACHYPIVLDRIIFALATVTSVKLLVESFPIFMYQVGRFKERQKQSESRRSFAPLDTIIGMVFFAIPAFVTTSVLRQFGNFGSDAVVSYVYFFAISLNWILANIGQHMMFASMLRGGMRGAGAEAVRRTIERNKFGMMLATVLYICSLLVVNIVAVYTPHGVTPFRIFCVLLRNMGTSVYYTYHYYHSWKMISRLTEMSNTMLDAKDKGEAASGGPHAAIMKAIEHLKGTLKAQVLIVTVVIPVLTIFSIIPQLFAYNQVPNGLLLVVATGKNHTIHAWAKKNHSESSNGQLSSSNNLTAVNSTNGVKGSETKFSSMTNMVSHSHTSARVS